MRALLAICSHFVIISLAANARPKCETSFPDGSPCDMEGIAKADPASCPAYYQCVSGCVEHKVCPGGEVFSDMYMECEPRDIVSCGQRPCEEEANCEGDTNPTANPGDCTPEDQWIDCSQTGQGWFADPFNCRRYWRCHMDAHGVERDHLICEDAPDGQPMMWDLQFDGCNFAEYTDCGDRPVCDECNADCQGGECPGHTMDCHDKPNGFYPDPYSCERFWECDHGNAFHFKCQEGLFYEPLKKECDWSWNVNCGNRPPCDECLGEC